MLVASDCFQPETEQLAEGFLTAAGQQAHGDDMPNSGRHVTAAITSEVIAWFTGTIHSV